jgi:hypothetical protein
MMDYQQDTGKNRGLSKRRIRTVVAGVGDEGNSQTKQQLVRIVAVVWNIRLHHGIESWFRVIREFRGSLSLSILDHERHE